MLPLPPVTAAALSSDVADAAVAVAADVGLSGLANFQLNSIT
jgi:hypothetical protein